MRVKNRSKEFSFLFFFLSSFFFFFRSKMYRLGLMAKGGRAWRYSMIGFNRNHAWRTIAANMSRSDGTSIPPFKSLAV